MAFVLPTPDAVAKRFQPAEAATETAPADGAPAAEAGGGEAKEEEKKEDAGEGDEKKEEAPKKPASVNFLGIAPGSGGEKKKPSSIVFGPQFRGVTATDKAGPKVKWGYVRVR